MKATAEATAMTQSAVRFILDCCSPGNSLPDKNDKPKSRPAIPFLINFRSVWQCLLKAAHGAKNICANATQSVTSNEALAGRPPATMEDFQKIGSFALLVTLTRPAEPVPISPGQANTLALLYQVSREVNHP